MSRNTKLLAKRTSVGETHPLDQEENAFVTDDHGLGNSANQEQDFTGAWRGQQSIDNLQQKFEMKSESGPLHWTTCSKYWNNLRTSGCYGKATIVIN